VAEKDKTGDKAPEKRVPFKGAVTLHGMRIPKGILLPPLFIPSILLLLKEEPSHGYSLLKKLSKVGVVDADMDPSPIYKVLRMLEEQGLAESEHESGDRGPARKVYRLTKQGDQTLTIMAGLIDKAAGIIEWWQDKREELG
jgi:PadR family transcriptional regulator